MKKKIKDLTIAECERICDKCGDCSSCLLNNIACKSSSLYLLLELERNNKLEREVEVDE